MLKSRLFWRILSYFGLLLLILLAMTYLTMRVLKEMESNFALASRDIRELSNLEPIRNYLTDLPAAADEYLLTGSPEAKALYEAGWKDFDVQINFVRKELADSSSQQDLTQLRQLFFGWLENVGDRKILLHESKEKPEVVHQELEKLAAIESEIKYLSTARFLVRSLYNRAITTQPARINMAAGLASDLRNFVLLVNILFAVFALVLGFALTLTITRPVKILRSGTRGIMEGSFSPIEIHRTDEFGELANDFNQMSSMLNNNYGRLKAYSELVTSLNVNETLDEVETNSLTLLCQHTGAAVGALYLMNRSRTSLERVAGYALNASEGLSKEYKIGEGIPGQCALQQSVLEIHDIASAIDFVVDTGLVRVVPSHVLAAPILFQEKVIGVIVLGSSQPFDELKKEIVANSLPQIGVGLTNARNVEATRKLSIEIANKNEELNGKNNELQKAYRVKSDFLANMSHELRTPLNSIIGFSSVLLGDSADPMSKDQNKALEKILRNGKHLLQLINDILDFSKIEAGRMPINVESEDVPSVVSGALMTVETLIKGKSLELKQITAPELPILSTDVLKVKQILVNLLSNATKFTDQGVIEVRAEMKGPLLAISVKDSGIGIAQKDLDRVFEEFQQVESTNTKKYKGTGLGLPISRRLARMLGGDLTVESELGKGSTFILTLPPMYVPDKQAEGATMIGSAHSVEPVASPAVAQKQAVPIMSVMPKQKSDGKTQVLCIDDDPDVIEILRSYLVPEGYSVAEANSGDDGIRIAEQLQPDLITLDIMMPQKDGWQVLRELKANKATKDIPVLIHSIIDNKPLAVHLGAIDVVTKPVDSKRLITLIESVCNTKSQFVMVVDDDIHYTAVLKELLNQDGYQVQSALSGEEALRMLETIRPALVILDLNLPGISGIEVVTKIREREGWRDIPIIILSGRRMTNEEEQIVRPHVLDFVHKEAFSNESISNTIRRILLNTPSERK